jgi:hypothetical protein
MEPAPSQNGVIDYNLINTPHIICGSCISVLKGDLIRLSKSGNLSDTKTHTIKCAICVKKTHKVEMKYIKQLIKSEGGCCSIL